MRFGVVGLGGPEPPMAVAASSSKTLKALKESAARALHFVHPSGNVWKPRHLFTETPSGNLRELQETSQITEEKVLWVEPPWKAGSVLQQGLTSRSRWTWGARLYQSLSRLPCCLPLYRWRSTAAAKGGRGAPRREQKVQKDPKRPTHFVSLRVGEDVQRATLKVQQELVGQADEHLRKDLERCLIPSGQFHLTLATLKLREEDLQVIREQLNQVSDLAGFHFKLKGLESFGQRVLFARACDDGSNGYAALCALHTRLADAFETCLPGVKKEAALSSETIETISTQEPEAAEAEVSQEKLSRFLTRVLRHDAKRLGLQMRSDGSVALKDLVALSFFRNNGFGEADVEREVKHNDKQRFSLWLEKGIKRIRANQGHKMKEVVDSELLTPISSSQELPVCIHGTYMKRWHHKKKSYVDVWPAIKREGLKPMGRNHIHFVPHEVGSRTVISGMRQDCTVAIYLDVPKALAMGIKLFRSSNDVVLSRGNECGHIPTELFAKAVEIKTGRLLWPPEAGADIATEEEDCFQPHMTLAKTSRAHDEARIPESCWQALRTVELGVVTADSLELCRMKGDPQTGYYEVDYKVSFKRSQRERK